MVTKWEHRFQAARLVAAAMLALAFFLPVASCTQSSFGKNVSAQRTEEIEETVETPHRNYKYPYKEVAMGDPATWYILGAFFWPLAALKFRERAPMRAGFILNTTEMLLCLLTGWVIWEFSFFYRLEYGGYIAYSAALIYGALSLADAARRVWRQFSGALRKRRSMARHQ